MTLNKISGFPYLLVVLVLVVMNCSTQTTLTTNYLDDIGDITFNKKLDDSHFKFCDSTTVLHKRAFVKYRGTIRQLENDLIHRYKIKPDYKNFSGYFFIRFAVNCLDTASRFRTEILDINFKEATAPKGLENSLLTILKNLQNWRHPVYEGKDYDGYTFIIIKIENGQIIRS